MAREKNEQHRFDSTRVKITMDVEEKGAQRKEEIPFVVGVAGDFGGDKKDPAAFRMREAIEIGEDNFDAKMAEIVPEVHFDSDLKDLGDNLSLKFTSMASFNPENVAREIDVLRLALEERAQYQALLSRLGANPGLREALDQLGSDLYAKA